MFTDNFSTRLTTSLSSSRFISLDLSYLPATLISMSIVLSIPNTIHSLIQAVWQIALVDIHIHFSICYFHFIAYREI